MGRYLLVGNPTAQSGKAAGYLERALAGLASRGVEARLLPTEPAGRTVGLVTRAVDAERPDVVVYLGGDGTFNEVARGLLAATHRAPLGMLPMGTANNQGRSLGVRPGPAAIEENLDVVLAGHVVNLDVGHCEALDERGAVRAEIQFFDSAGWGMQPEILAQRNRDRADVAQIPILRELYRDQAVYAGAALERFVASFVEPMKFTAEVTSGETTRRWEGLTDLIVSGTPIYAGEWVVDRFAESDDGKFELVPMQGRRDWASKALRDLRVLPLFQEDLDVIGVTHATGYSASDFRIRLSREGRAAIASQIDGEEWVAGEDFRVTVLANRLPVIAPRDFVPPWRFDRAAR
ncbi:MAG: hypothetical protein KF729_06625 [Sandaracinaceae bacterium]|nr:hypothetical protein [Sandaracinaceae bacterium]